ncbi:hypothetical protein C8R46DRAFT_1042177 [Mycena filopes]|nr:hypothetical protein C8R46DRAFT_1042177 [Mycena filopes]
MASRMSAPLVHVEALVTVNHLKNPARLIPAEYQHPEIVLQSRREEPKTEDTTSQSQDVSIDEIFSQSPSWKHLRLTWSGRDPNVERTLAEKFKHKPRLLEAVTLCFLAEGFDLSRPSDQTWPFGDRLLAFLQNCSLKRLELFLPGCGFLKQIDQTQDIAGLEWKKLTHLEVTWRGIHMDYSTAWKVLRKCPQLQGCTLAMWGEREGDTHGEDLKMSNLAELSIRINGPPDGGVDGGSSFTHLLLPALKTLRYTRAVPGATDTALTAILPQASGLRVLEVDMSGLRGSAVLAALPAFPCLEELQLLWGFGDPHFIPTLTQSYDQWRHLKQLRLRGSPAGLDYWKRKFGGLGVGLKILAWRGNLLELEYEANADDATPTNVEVHHRSVK